MSLEVVPIALEEANAFVAKIRLNTKAAQRRMSMKGSGLGPWPPHTSIPWEYSLCRGIAGINLTTLLAEVEKGNVH